MPSIHLTTFIAAPADRVFNLSRSIELHKKSMEHTGEQAIAGTVGGLIGPNETVTWRARHLGKTRVMKIMISSMQANKSFTDEMVSGDLKNLKHEHHFMPVKNGTLMIDLFSFETPWGWLGRTLDFIFLKRYFRKMLEQRNHAIKEYAEGDKWKFLLDR